MALLGHDARRLVAARARGVCFDDTLTIGRLSLFLHAGELEDLRRNLPVASPALERYAFGDYADDFLRDCLGVQSLTVLDRSDYEGAGRVHDLNDPLQADLVGRFDAVIEAGSLEHVFNFPVAAANLMNALKVGGTLFLTAPANNLCGHGLYQFSPELMYRTFSRENGFDIRTLAVLEARFPAVESTPVRRIRYVPDPATVGRRIGLRTRRPVLMALEATKVSNVTPFAEWPQQSDYVTRWTGRRPSRFRWARAVLERLPRPLRTRVVAGFHLWEYSFHNQKTFRRSPNHTD